jgi:hypothetical protein
MIVGLQFVLLALSFEVLTMVYCASNQCFEWAGFKKRIVGRAVRKNSTVDQPEKAAIDRNRKEIESAARVQNHSFVRFAVFSRTRLHTDRADGAILKDNERNFIPLRRYDFHSIVAFFFLVTNKNDPTSSSRMNQNQLCVFHFSPDNYYSPRNS